MVQKATGARQIETGQPNSSFLKCAFGMPSSWTMSSTVSMKRGVGSVPDSFAGKTLQELNVRRRFGISVLGLKDALTGKLSMFPESGAKLGADQILLVVGNKDQLARVRELE